MAFASGASLPHLGAALPLAPLAVSALCLLIYAFHRPSLPVPLLVGALAGAWLAGAWLEGQARDCRNHLTERAEVSVAGVLLARDHGSGGAVPFQITNGLDGGCVGQVRLYPPESRDGIRAGARVEVEGVWRRSRLERPGRPEMAGYVSAREVHVASRPGQDAPGIVTFRGAIQERVAQLFRHRAGMVDALLLARREGLDPELRQAFAHSGTAHLLAISGFHVGLVAALLLGLLRAAGIARRSAVLGASLGTALYVAGIGFPHAATRAGAILLFAALARLRGRPVHSIGALATALLCVLLMDPGATASAGFQLSFAGAAGLALLYRPLLEGLRAALRNRFRFRVPSYLEDGLASGTAATLPTLPLVAWHFDRVSWVGIPVTVAVTPLISVAVPGIIAALALSVPFPVLGRFLAGGVEVVLHATEALVREVAALPGVAPWIPRWWLVALGAGAVLSWVGLAWDPGARRRIGLRTRAYVLVAGAAAALLLWPPLSAGRGGGGVEVHFLDVGQGDAAAVRTRRGRWLLVDAGPSSPTFDAGERRVTPFLRRSGVGTLEVAILSHPHLDHFGGGEAVLDAVRVRGFLDPAWPAPSRPYLELLERARGSGISWWAAREGLEFQLDGVDFYVHHPREEDVVPGATDDPNEVSVVVRMEYGLFTVLFTGDAYVEQERHFGPEAGPIRVLKAGHHGSRTSSGRTLLEAAEPEIAVLSMGAGNPFGHPHREVVRRLEEHGVRMFRTDRRGTVSVVGRRDGSFTVETERGQGDAPLFR